MYSFCKERSLEIEDEAMLLQGIFRKDNIWYKSQDGKYDEVCEELLKNLAKEFVHAE